MAMNTTSRWGWTLFFFFALVLLVGSGMRDLWNPDEPRFGQVTREMLQSGQYAVPTLNEEIYTDKPPAFFWLSALAAKLFHGGAVNEWTTRFPSVAAGIGSLLLVLCLGRRMFNPVAGLLALMVLATTYRFWWQAAWAQLDMLLCFFILSALTCFWFAYTSLKTNSFGAKFLIWSGFYLALAGGFLTKGPIGILFPCGIIFFFLIWDRRFSFLLKMWIPLGLLILAAAVGGWIWAAYQTAGAGYLYEHLIVHNFVRYTEPWGHIRPFYYYLYNFPADCLPWVVFLPFAFIQYRRRESGLSSPHRFLTVWFLLIFIFFSLSDSKRNLYLLPLFPSVALFLGEYFSEMVSNRKIQKGFMAVISFGTVVFAAAVLVAFPLADRVKSARHLCEEVGALKKEKGVVACFKFYKESFLYYMPPHLKVIKIEEPDELKTFLQESVNHTVLVQKKKMHFLDESWPLEVLAGRQVGGDEFIVASWKR